MARHVTAQAPAKINLTLDITGRREDGYHLLRTVMQSIDLCDRVTVTETGTGDITLETEEERLPSDNTNTVWRATEAFFEATGLPNPGVALHLTKRIPMEAGLAGGSADAAGALVALNRLIDTRLGLDELCDIGARVGADVPFCVMGGAADCTGTGTILDPLPSMPDCLVVVAKPPCGVSTAEAYRRVDTLTANNTAAILRRPHTGRMLEALCGGDLLTIGRELCNVFESTLALPEVAVIAAVMRRYQTLGCAMTGSGSAVFGLFTERFTAQRCLEALRDQTDACFLCHPCNTGAHVEE